MRALAQKWFFYNDDKKHHVRALDGLRGIAVIMVLLSHSSNHGIYFLPSLRFNGIGIGGVYLFFTLSAYLLDSQIANSLINHKADIHFWKYYFLRRLLRIYPLLSLALLVFFLLASMGIPTCIIHGQDIVNHLLLRDGCSVFWSIPVEFNYYFISPLILLFCHYIFRWDWVKTGLLLTGMATCFLLGDWLFGFHKLSLFKYLIVFLTGTFIAVFHLLRQPEKLPPGLAKYIGLAGFIALFLCLFLNENYVGQWMVNSLSHHGRKSMLIYVALCGILLLAALYDKGYFRKFLENKILRFTGVISYSIYLFHLPILLLMEEKIIQVPPYLGIYVFLGSTISLSLITYFLIERPLALIPIPKSSPSSTNPLP